MSVRAALLGFTVLLIPVAQALPMPDTSTILAQMFSDMPPPPRESGKDGVPPWFNELNLTSEQQTKIRALHTDFKENNEDTHQQLRRASEQLRSLMDGNSSDESIRKQFRVVQDLRQTLDNAQFEMRLAERKILTAAQRQQLGQWMEQNRPKRPQREG